MKFTKEIVDAINSFIIENIPAHQNDILSFVMSYFEISKPTAAKYLNKLIESGIIQKSQKGRYPNYHLVDSVFSYTYHVPDHLDENTIWRNDISPHFTGIAQNVRQACQYGFTEMVNNVIDHSESDELDIIMSTNAREVEFMIADYGIGIFNKIKNDLGLDDPRHSILELAKGKFTSDPQQHSGEGIFFTSRIFDFFAIVSGNLSFFGHQYSDWLLENTADKNINGTTVIMRIRKNSPVSMADIFNEYSNPDTHPGFYKTIIPVQLMQYEGDALMSRSQAKRLITRFDRFLEVVLDFTGVTIIGQGFADEIFRIFTREHPQVNLVPINCNETVKKMIYHVTSSNDRLQNNSD
jgi:anti-sigma regulatory factor (Ser/Thr protein kinase)